MRRAAAAAAAALALVGLVVAGCGSDDSDPGPVGSPPAVKHVFIVVLENKNYDDAFGDEPKSEYVGRELPKQGQLLTQFHGVAHRSLPNYIAMVSGQPPSDDTQANCQTFTDFELKRLEGSIAVGNGCVYPPEIKTVADQLEEKGLTWKGYMQGMGTPCRHPEIGADDDTQNAEPDDMYATRHNPFVYFHSIIDRPICKRAVVDLDRLPQDLRSAETTPNLVYITPDLCDDGHDEPCVDGRPGGLESAGEFLRRWVPQITASPAFKKDGLLIVTFDESEDDNSACCYSPAGPNVDHAGGPEGGEGGGRTGTVLISPFVDPGTRNDTPYNHYSLLRSVEDIFGLPHLGYAAQDGLRPFGRDVFDRRG